MLTLIIALTYSFLCGLLIKHYMRGYKRLKAKMTIITLFGLPRFTVREPNGRFKANKVGIWYIINHGV